MRIVTIILGIILLAGGVFCMFTPIETYSVLSWLIGLAMVVEGVGSIVTWNSRRKLGFADIWTLVGAIVSLALGLFLLGSYVAQFAVDLFIAILIAIWLVVGGVTRIAAAISIRSNQNRLGSGGVPSGWGTLFALGVVFVILGVLCLINPTSIMIGVGFMLGLSIAFVGAGLILSSLRA